MFSWLSFIKFEDGLPVTVSRTKLRILYSFLPLRSTVWGMKHPTRPKIDSKIHFYALLWWKQSWNAPVLTLKVGTQALYYTVLLAWDAPRSRDWGKKHPRKLPTFSLPEMWILLLLQEVEIIKPIFSNIRTRNAELFYPRPISHPWKETFLITIQHNWDY